MRNNYCPREIDLQDKSLFILFIGPGTEIFFNASLFLFSFFFISLWIKGIFLLITGASKTTISGLIKQGKRSSQNPRIYDLVYTSCFCEVMEKQCINVLKNPNIRIMNPVLAGTRFLCLSFFVSSSDLNPVPLLLSSLLK